MLSSEQKRQNAIDRRVERFRALQIGKCVKDVAKAFQKLRRLESVDRHGMLTCCSCGKRDYPGRGFDGGHWIGCASKSVVFEPRNVHPQCVSCNRYQSGPVKANYDRFMELTYGREVMDELIRKSKEIKQFTREELAELKQDYLDAIRLLT